MQLVMCTQNIKKGYKNMWFQIMTLEGASAASVIVK